MTIEQRTQAAITTLQATGSKAAAAAAFVFPSSMSWSGGRSGLLYSTPAQRGTLWRNADPTESSAVMNTLTWISRNFGQGEFCVCATDRKGKESPIENHPLQQLLERPNPYYGGHTLWAGTLLSYHLDGNAYWLKVRNARGFGLPNELWYEPHWSMNPHYPEDGSAFIDYYERRVNGTIQKIDPRNVIHFRQGLNPADTRRGLSPLRAALVQIFADQEVDAWIGALAKNMAIPGVIVNPTSAIGMTAEKAEAIKQTWKRKFGGDNRGEPLILDFEAQVSTLGYDPESMNFTAIHHHAESRIAGALGVPPQLTFLNVANDSSSYNNLTTFERIGWEQGIIPVYENFEDTLDTQLLPDFEQDPIARGVYCEFKTDHVRALKEAQKEKEARVLDRVRAGVMTVSTAQAELGMEPDPTAEYYLIPNTVTPKTSVIAMEQANTAPQPTLTATTDEQNADPSPNPPAGKALPTMRFPLLPPASVKSVEWEGLVLRREPTELEALAIKAIDDLMTDGAVSIGSVLISLRELWVDDLARQLDAIEDPAEFDQVEIDAPETERGSMILAALAIFGRAAALIIEELRRQGATAGTVRAAATSAEMAPIIDAVITRAKVETIVRAIYSAASAVLLNQPVGPRVREDFAAGSLAYTEQIASEAANSVIARGRREEMKKRGDQIDFLIYSAVLDAATCQPCGRDDGKTGQLDNIPDVPNPDCKGGARCRCVHIAALKPEE